MKFEIEKKYGMTRIFDNKGNKVYWKDSEGFWIKSKFDNKGNKVYWEDSNGFWIKSKFDNKGNKVYWEDSKGFWIKSKFDNKGNEIYWENYNGDSWKVEPKEKLIIEVKDLNECLKQIKNDT